MINNSDILLGLHLLKILLLLIIIIIILTNSANAPQISNVALSRNTSNAFTVWKVSKYDVFSCPYFLYSDWIRENTDQKKLRL